MGVLFSRFTYHFSKTHIVIPVMHMKKSAWMTYGFWILLTEAVGLLAGFLIRDGVAVYQATAAKPPLTPPGAVFPIVWSLLYLLMGVGIARVRLTGPSVARERATALFVLQLAINFLWCLVFFDLRAFGAAFALLVALWVLILLMLLAFQPLDSLAARLQLPYLIWVTFAGYLNLGVWFLNR